MSPGICWVARRVVVWKAVAVGELQKLQCDFKLQGLENLATRTAARLVSHTCMLMNGCSATVDAPSAST